MRYLILIEPTANGFSAYVPDIDGCIATLDATTAAAYVDIQT